jgi:hypothetical protein
MKHLIKKILKEDKNQKSLDFIYKHLKQKTPIINGYLDTTKINSGDNVVLRFGNNKTSIKNLEDLKYINKNIIEPYLDSLGLTGEEIKYISDKFLYEYSYLEGKGPKPGDIIVLDSTTDPYTELKKGSKGVFIGYDGIENVLVKWENGSRLSLIPEEDKFHFISK